MYQHFFDESEFLCHCGCGMSIDPELKDMLGVARHLAGCPFVVTSPARCKKDNKRVGGSTTSSHLGGWAVDIKCSGSPARSTILSSLVVAGFKRIGLSTAFIHVDIDPSKPDALWLY